ncbi:MBL fold metallo-hydrolase [Salisaeta longa]|uniref:MBL fold metallo-hydrolase n=1 Tax=Salisaeta longa TaxID=503170 RepID=UPI0003B39C43|nr:MBL fold metallo-hydrolase [Salisaeta longa]
MHITCWGVRGSIAVPNPAMARYGGNTSCVSVEHEGVVLILDAGTGIRPLGAALSTRDVEVFVALTHLHTDHIEGFPFFRPLYDAAQTVHLVDYQYDATEWSLTSTMDGVHFPLKASEIPATLRHHDALQGALAPHGWHVTTQRVNHPGGAYGYRITCDGRTLVYIPDNEIATRRAEATVSFDTLASFCQGADILIHDAQYTDCDMPDKRGWGHSCLKDVCELVQASGVDQVVLFHHDPERTDEAIDEVQATAREYLADTPVTCTAAYEGLSFALHGARSEKI